MDIKNASVDELMEEIERRKKQKPIRPSQQPHPEFDIVRKEVTAFLDYIQNTVEYSDDDRIECMESIAVAAVNSFYPESIWETFIVPMIKWHKMEEILDEEGDETV